MEKALGIKFDRMYIINYPEHGKDIIWYIKSKNPNILECRNLKEL